MFEASGCKGLRAWGLGLCGNGVLGFRFKGLGV